MRGVMVILLALMLTGQAWAAIDTWQFKDEAQEQAFREITSQLRCPKCQNNSIADSNAMIAADMRQKVYELMQQGKTKGQIVDYMVARYGHFVSYEPPLTAGTVLLWLGPGLFVLAGAGVIIARARRRDIPDAALTAEERQRLAALLQEGKNDEPVGGYRRAAAGWRAGAAVLPVVGQRGGRPRCPQPRPVPVAPAGAGAGARRGQPGAGRRAAAHAADGYSAPGTVWRTAATPLGAASGRAAAGGPESGPVSENQRYWSGAALAAG